MKIKIKGDVRKLKAQASDHLSEKDGTLAKMTETGNESIMPVWTA